MHALYKHISLQEAQPGMSLSDDLLDGNGNILLTRGVVLTPQIITSLARHGITAIFVACAEPADSELEELHSHHKQRLDRLFRKPASDARDATGILQQYVSNFRMGEQA